MRLLTIFASAFVIAASISADDEPPLSFERDAVLVHEGQAASFDAILRPKKKGTGIVNRRVVRHPDGAKFIRVEAKTSAPTESLAWHVEIRSLNDDFLGTIRRPAPVQGAWEDDPAPPLPAEVLFSDDFPPQSAVDLVLIADEANAAPEVQITALTLETVRTSAESIPDGKDQLEDFHTQARDDFKAWGAAVARLRWSGINGKVYHCTGFLVAADLLMTNYHCIKYTDEMKNAWVDFGADSEGAPLTRRKLADLAKRNAALDLAIFRLSEPVAATPLRLSSDPMGEKPGPFVIIQHPGGRWKKISCENCVVDRIAVVGSHPAKKTDFGHQCDTHTGSSGAPVQDATSGVVVGLHHLGEDKVNKALVNRAVHSSELLQFLKQHATKVFDTLVSQ